MNDPASITMLPKSACAYEIYDAQTLKPGNDSTYVRLIELGWTKEEFAGKSVLDVGANTGLLSLRAHQLGAAAVRAVDVQAPLVEFLAAVVKRHKLPIAVERLGFDQLEPARHAADIVLFMEVLHWIVDQGGTVPGAIARLAGLTRETLYLETPWDVNEPSIAAKGIVTAEQYNIELVLRELSRHFRDVRVVRFMTYFGTMKNSKRVLIRATSRRAASVPLADAGELNLLDLSLMRGANAIELVTSPNGPKVLKRIQPDCTLARLQPLAFESLCSYLADLKEATIIAPERLGSGYRQRAEDGHSYMLFPFVGILGEFFPVRKFPPVTFSPLDIAVRLRRDLRPVPLSIIEGVRQVQRPTPLGDPAQLPEEMITILQTAGLLDFCSASFEKARNHGPGDEDCLIHNDMQTGNMVRDANGKVRVVDIDIIHTGTAYQDMITCGIYTGASPEALAQAIFSQAQEEARPPSRHDFDISVACTITWLKAINASARGIPEPQLQKYLTGLQSVVTLAAQV
jgi:hypothetical protein